MSGPATRIAVTVTFLRQDAKPSRIASPFPPDVRLVRLPRPSVAFYRYLYDTVGGRYVWWLRRAMPDHQLAELLAAPGVSVYVLYRNEEPAGFFELDARAATSVNISYFGLMQQAIGLGLGRKLLDAAVDQAWSLRPTCLTVNTCTADHPAALPTYLRSGFQAVRTVREVWDVPNRLGLAIPGHLRV
jgi:GNAT superfamily N-acetyltransferase